jgi:outer membrane protein assembly factor BamB
MQGKPLWSKQFGQMQTRNGFGEGASATLAGNRVYVIWDHEGADDFVAALDKVTGKELWRTPREEATGWATPLVVEHGRKTQVVINATGRVRSYDAETGKELWQAGGQTANAIPTPVADKETVYVTSGFRGAAFQAIALGNSGDLTGSKSIRWSYDKQTPYVPSPLLAGEFLYFTAANTPVLTCLDVKTGQPHFAGERIEGLSGVYASMVEAKERVYLLGRDGNCVVFKKGPKFEVLARNRVDDKTDSSIALAGKDLFIRGHQYVYCIGDK